MEAFFYAILAVLDFRDTDKGFEYFLNLPR